MAKTPKQLDEFFEPLRGQDLTTLRALDQKLHLLLEQRLKDQQPTNDKTAANMEIARRCPSVKIDPELVALVGIHPENPIEEDKSLIREAIARRLAD
jgi:hypothetical protein